LGFLHHLSDNRVAGLISNLIAWLKPGGFLYGPIESHVSPKPQNAIAHYLIRNDRGEFVRTPEALQELFCR